MNSETSAEEKIILAAIDCINEEGLEAMTIRKVAERAGVNSAAINYYFRSKDNLVKKVIDITLKNAFDWSDFRESDESEPIDRLTVILNHLMEGVVNFPGITRAHFSGVFNGDYSGPSMDAFSLFLKNLEEDLTGRGVELDKKTLQLAIIQIISATLLPLIFAPRLYDQFASVDLHNEETRKEYIRLLAKSLLRCPNGDKK